MRRRGDSIRDIMPRFWTRVRGLGSAWHTECALGKQVRVVSIAHLYRREEEKKGKQKENKQRASPRPPSKRTRASQRAGGPLSSAPLP